MEFVKYKSACLHCLHSSGVNNLIPFDGLSEMIKLKNQYSRGFYATLILKEKLHDIKEKCEACGSIGSFDVCMAINNKCFRTCSNV